MPAFFNVNVGQLGSNHSAMNFFQPPPLLTGFSASSMDIFAMDMLDTDNSNNVGAIQNNIVNSGIDIGGNTQAL